MGSTRASKGVFNINKGYTVFKEIEILDSNSEYYTIKKEQATVCLYMTILCRMPLWLRKARSCINRDRCFKSGFDRGG